MEFITVSLTDICYENNFFDQAHILKDFQQYTGDSPEKFKRSYKKTIFYNFTLSFFLIFVW